MLLLQIAHKYTATGLHACLQKRVRMCVCGDIVATTVCCNAVALAPLHDSCLFVGHLACRLKAITTWFVVAVVVANCMLFFAFISFTAAYYFSCCRRACCCSRYGYLKMPVCASEIFPVPSTFVLAFS